MLKKTTKANKIIPMPAPASAVVAPARRTVFVFGDGMLDKYWIGEAHRLSPEAPIPVVDITRTETFSGGALNVRDNIRALEVDAECFSEDPACPVKNRLMVGNTQLARWDEQDTCAAISPTVVAGLPKPDAIVISDYGKGSITPLLVDWIRDQHVPTFIDTKRDPRLFGMPTAIYFPNKAEFEMFEPSYSVLQTVVLKLGADGLMLLGRGKKLLHIPAYASHVLCVNGAGDTVIAATVAGTVTGRYQHDALRFASVAAAVVVEKPFTAVATLEEVYSKADTLGFDLRP